MNQLKRVLIADDQHIVRSALKVMLEENGLYPGGDVSSSQELLDWLMTNETDVVLLDWELPGQSCKTIIPIIHSRYPTLSVIVMDSRPQTITEALSAGADVFVSKGDPPEYLLAAIDGFKPHDNLK